VPYNVKDRNIRGLRPHPEYTVQISVDGGLDLAARKKKPTITLKKKVVGVPFTGRLDPRNGKGGARIGAGRPSELHRAECRRLVDDHKIRELFAKAADGERVDVYFTLGGKMKRVPTSFANRIKAGLALMEQGHGTKIEHEHSVSPETIRLFGERLTTIFQRHLPKFCPHCKTDLSMPPELTAEIMQLSRMFEQPVEEAARAH
jgi:hypothetical protein